MIEEILADFKRSKDTKITKQPDNWRIVVLRYFNPVSMKPLLPYKYDLHISCF